MIFIFVSTLRLGASVVLQMCLKKFLILLILPQQHVAIFLPYKVQCSTHRRCRCHGVFGLEKR